MNRKVFTMSLVVGMLLMETLGLAQVPKLVNYQGKLVDANGNPVPDGEYTLTFRIYDVSSGGTALWEEVQQVYVEGVSNRQLGSVFYINHTDYLRLGRFMWSSVDVVEQVGGVPKSKGSYTYTVPLNKWHTIISRMIGSFIETEFYDPAGDLITTISGTITHDYSNRKIGFFNAYTAGYENHFSLLQVRKYTSPEPTSLLRWT